MFSKSCRLVNEHLVSPTCVAYVSFLCHCVLHSMEDSKKKYFFILILNLTHCKATKLITFSVILIASLNLSTFLNFIKYLCSAFLKRAELECFKSITTAFKNKVTKLPFNFLPCLVCIIRDGFTFTLSACKINIIH